MERYVEFGLPKAVLPSISIQLQADAEEPNGAEAFGLLLGRPRINFDVFEVVWKDHLAFFMPIQMSNSQRMLLKFSQTLTGLQIVKRDESVSCCCIFLGGCLIFSASRTQKVVSLSSAEAEVYACSSGSSDAILLARLRSWLTGRRAWIYVYTDSSRAREILQRQGVGRLRHLSCRVLWLQALIANGTIRLCSVSGHVSLADIGTKRLSAARLRSLMAVLGLCNKDVGALEGVMILEEFSSNVKT